jgi:alanyl aminopeptidase
MCRRLPWVISCVAARHGGAAPRPPAARGEPPVEPAFRPPAGVRPTREALDLSVDAAGETFAGTATIGLAVDAPTDAAWLRGAGLVIKAVEVEGPAGPVPASWAVRPGGRHVRRAHVASARARRGAAAARVRYEGRLDAEKSRGLYRAREPDGRWYAYAFFEPVDARRAFPCFGEPGYEIPWSITLRVPPGDVALANAPAASEAVEGGGGWCASPRRSRRRAISSRSRPGRPTSSRRAPRGATARPCGSSCRGARRASSATPGA